MAEAGFDVERIRLIVANGCSCTAGEELRKPDESAWPLLLAARLGVPCVNLAANSTSNRRIIRTTVSAMLDPSGIGGVGYDEVLFVPAWTELSRAERYQSTLEGWTRRRRRTGTADDGWMPIGSWLAEDGDPASRSFYRDLYHPVGQETAFLTDWVLLDAFLLQRHVQRLYAFAFPFRPSDPAAPLAQTVAGFPMLGGFPTEADRSCESFLDGADHLPKGPGGHPLEAGHEWFARALYDRLHAGG